MAGTHLSVVVVHDQAVAIWGDGVRKAAGVRAVSRLNVTDGIFRVRYRKGFDRPEPVDSDEGVFEIVITPFATANLFRAGHRLRLDISSSNFPKYDVNPNTGEPEGQSRRGRVAFNQVHMGSSYPSRLELLRLAEQDARP